MLYFKADLSRYFAPKADSDGLAEPNGTTKGANRFTR